MALSPKERYILEKPVWTEADFEKMGWHDVVIHGFSFNLPQYELLFDIDYIFAWVDPEPPSEYFSFWISPATLVFQNVHDFRVNIKGCLGWQLQGIERNKEQVPRNSPYINDKKEWEWTLEANEGQIRFFSTGFTQFTRSVPRHRTKQSLKLEDRGGISFERLVKPKEIE
jgi:hypothetical protein